MATNIAEPHSSTLSDRIICDLSDKLSSTLTCITSRIAIDDGTFVLQELASFEADILASIQRTVHAQRLLLHTRDSVREVIRSIQTVVGPVQKLPLELVGEILQNYLSPDQTMMLPPSHRCELKLVIFGQVCRQWRAAAFMAPVSWSFIHISIPQILDLAKAEKLRNLLNIVLERSEMCSLHLRFTVYPVIMEGDSWPTRTTNGDALRTVFQPLVRHAHRWKDINFDVTFAALEALLKDSPLSSLSVPRLEAFSMRGEFGVDDTRRLLHNQVRPLITFPSTPSLRRVSLFHVGLLAAHSSSFSWDQLDELSIVGFFPGHLFFDCVATLQGCNRLTSCRISTSEHTRSFLNGAPIVLETLVHLHIDEHGVPDGSGDIYRQMICPNLKTFVLHFVVPARHNIQHHHLFWTRDCISIFLSHTPQLRQLQLWDPPLDVGGLTQVLNFVPDLSHLTVSDLGSVCSIGNRLLHDLILPVSSDKVPLVRRLESLHIESRACSEHFMVALVQSRWRGNLGLTHLQLHLPGTGLAVNLYRSLKRFLDGGLVLEISG